MKNNQYIGIRMHDLGLMKPQQLADSLSDYGFSCGQLAIPKSIPDIASYHDVTDDVLSDINAAFDQKGIRICVLGCYIDPALQDETQRKKQLDIFEKGIYCANALKADCIATETTNFDGDKSQWRNAFSILCGSVEHMLKKAEPLGVTVAIEPVRFHTLRSPEATYRLLKCFKGENLKIIFDALNLISPSEAKSQQALWNECLDAFGEDIIACHIKDAVLNEDKSDWIETPLGKGILDYTDILKGLKRLNKKPALLREGFYIERARAEYEYLEDMASACSLFGSIA